MKLDLTSPFDINKANTYFNKLMEQGKQIELKEVRKVRTIKQNAYLHVCITLFAIEFGWRLDHAKTHIKRNCPFMLEQVKGETFLRRTRDMNTKELTDFIDWIRTYSGQLGCYLPDPTEYLAQKFEIDKEIDRHKEYL